MHTTTTNRNVFSMRHPLPWAWLANILPGDRWRPFRRWGPCTESKWHLHPIQEAKQRTTKCKQQTLHLQYASNATCISFLQRSYWLESQNLCVSTTPVSLPLESWEAWPWPEGVKTPQPPRRPVIHVPWWWLRGGNWWRFEDHNVCRSWWDNLPYILASLRLRSSHWASCQQVSSQLAPRLLCVRLCVGRRKRTVGGLQRCTCLSLHIATHLCFPVTLPPTMRNWNKWTCFCFAAFDLEAACHDVEGNLFATVYISTYWWARSKVENMTISTTFVMRPALRHLAFKEKIAPRGFVSPRGIKKGAGKLCTLALRTSVKSANF